MSSFLKDWLSLLDSRVLEVAVCNKGHRLGFVVLNKRCRAIGNSAADDGAFLPGSLALLKFLSNGNCDVDHGHRIMFTPQHLSDLYTNPVLSDSSNSR